jgi:hypothetical protein
MPNAERITRPIEYNPDPPNMTQNEAYELVEGVYRLFWKDDEGGGMSVASVGRTHTGEVWFAPANWLGQRSTDWRLVDRIELIEASPPRKSLRAP